MEQNPHPSLEMDDDARRQTTEWRTQRIGWIVIGVLLVAVACGLFGWGGPLSETRAAAQDGSVRIEYERFVRYESPDSLRVLFRASSDRVRVRMDSAYAGKIQIDRISPQPLQEIGEGDAVVYEFSVKPNAEVTATFHFVPQKYGSLDGWIAVADGPPVQFGHFVYP